MLFKTADWKLPSEVYDGSSVGCGLETSTVVTTEGDCAVTRVRSEEKTQAKSRMLEMQCKLAEMVDIFDSKWLQ